MDHGDRVAHERQRRAQALADVVGIGQGDVAGLPARGRAQIRQVDGDSLLQLTRPRRGEQGRTQRAAAHVDEQAGAIGLRAGAGEGGRGGLRAAGVPERGDEDHASAHLCPGLA